ncbi:MAG: GGDEF domain-containing protein, partial [Planctomycetota bacterium]
KRLSVEIRRSLAKDNDLSLVFFDLDNFKDVNDTYGHLAGSHVLSEVGGILKSCTEKRRDFVPVRYGGDEFSIILSHTDIDSAGKFAEDLRKTIEEYVFLESRVPGTSRALKLKGLVTCSIGVASLKTSAGVKKTVKDLTEAVIKRADTAMYRAKQSGKNKVIQAT